MRRSIWILGLASCLAAGPPAARSLAQHAPGGAPSRAQPNRPPFRAEAREAAPQPGAQGGLPALPPDRTTDHTLRLGDHTIDFAATAGVIRLSNAANGAPLADVAYVAYQKKGGDPARRPIVFIFNGGPGYASGWLDLGGLGPWRLPMQAGADRPSAPPLVQDNPQTWLDFADLVFIDPPGTGYSRILGNDDIRKQLWSVNGDVDALATVIRRWIEQNNRMASPKFIAGESYGGFRAPKVAHELDTDQGVGVSGLIMISPVLEFSRFNSPDDPMSLAADLPSETAVAREAKGPISRSALADVEAYARTNFILDLMKGPNDHVAVDRLVKNVSSFTGLDPAYVRRMGGRITTQEFRREFWRSRGKIGSQYDGSVAGYDPTPFSPRSSAPDQLRVGLNAPIVEAMVGLYHQQLDWTVPRGRYQFFNEEAARRWSYGRKPEAIEDLKEDLALDPSFRALIVQGLTDLVTPYFATQMEINQIPDYGPAGRLTLRVYPGGHMIYIRNGARQALHDDAAALVRAVAGGETAAPAPNAGKP